MLGMTLNAPRRRQATLAGNGARNDNRRGSSAVELDRRHTILEAIWAPIPWMLEAMFVLLFARGDYTGMMTVAVLLAFNVAFGVAGEKVRARAGRRLPR